MPFRLLLKSSGKDMILYMVFGINGKPILFFKRNSALFFYRAMDRLGVNLVPNHADFRLMSGRAIEELLKFKETNLFLRGLVPLVGFNSTKVYYNRK